MRPVRSRSWRVAFAASASALAVLLAACGDRPLPTVVTSAPGARFTIVAQLQRQQTAAAQSVSVFAGYALTSGLSVVLAQQTVSVAASTQQLSLSVDLTACLADATRVGPSSACPLLVGVIARNAAGATIDSMVAGPFSVTPGHASAPLDVALSLADIMTLAWGDTLRISAPTAAAGTAVASFSSSDTSIATVASDGLVTTRTVGRVTITATSGQATATARLQVSPRATESLAAGDNFSCALTVTGAAYCWGEDSSGQLGDGGNVASNVPVPVSGSLTFRQITAGGLGVCGITSTSRTYCWGRRGTSTNSTPLPITGTQLFQSVNSGYGFACGVTVTGAAYCWGSNAFGQLGRGDTVSTNLSPVLVSGGLTWQHVSAGLFTACGLTPGGAAYCWGEDQTAGLGVSPALSGTVISLPVPVSGGLIFTQVSAGATTACGLTASGAAYCWGTNFSGSLGLGSVASQTAITPTAITGGIVFASVNAATGNNIFDPACGLTADGTAYCWGANSNGQLGTTAPLSTCTYSANSGATSSGCTGTPTPVTTTAKFQVISQGGDHVCGITTTQTILCWGRNTSGQLGDGTTTNQATPVAAGRGLIVP